MLAFKASKILTLNLLTTLHVVQVSFFLLLKTECPDPDFCLCRASEGRTVQIPYKGDVEDTIRDILGGLRSTCTYVGAAKLKELSRRTTFIRVTQQSSQMFT